MASSGLVWDDASLNIPWEEWKTEYNIDQFIISEQDLNWEGINNIQAQVI
jgi:dTDP-4-dehydrorhamnose 3,5-epimerase-like enzyme